MCCNIFLVCNKHSSLPLGPIQPSSPSTKELHARTLNLRYGTATYLWQNVSHLVPNSLEVPANIFECVKHKERERERERERENGLVVKVLQKNSRQFMAETVTDVKQRTNGSIVGSANRVSLLQVNCFPSNFVSNFLQEEGIYCSTAWSVALFVGRFVGWVVWF